jgi:uncharacterized membrane protein
MTKDIDGGFSSYLFGVLSVVFAFVQPLAGLILGIITLKQSSQQKTDVEKKAKKLGIIGTVVGAVIFILQLVLTYAQTISLLA